MFIPGYYKLLAASAEGRRLTAACYANEHGFIECSIAGIPAVAALVEHLTLCEPWVKNHDLAKCFLGWLTGEIVKSGGRVMVADRARVPGDIFVWGAVWSAEPSITSVAA